MEIFRSRYWLVGRRIVLVIIALFVGYRSYGDAIAEWFRGPDPTRDIVITQSEFRPVASPGRPLWFIGLRNTNDSIAYDRILMQATYVNAAGETVEVDSLRIHQRLSPGQEETLASRDAAIRDGATDGSLKVLDAEVVD